MRAAVESSRVEYKKTKQNNKKKKLCKTPHKLLLVSCGGNEFDGDWCCEMTQNWVCKRTQYTENNRENLMTTIGESIDGV